MTTNYTLLYSKQAKKDYKKIKGSELNQKVLALLETLKTNPYQNPPPYEKLLGDLAGMYSRRINIQHRMVYQVLKEKKVRVLRMWTHYE